MIATKFPSYAIRHPNKVVWLVHQFRQAYELDGTDLGQFGDGADRAGDASGGSPARPRRRSARRGGCSRSRRTSPSGFARSIGLDAEVLPPPPQPLDYRCEELRRFVLSVGRLDRAKRVDLLLEAAAADGRACARRRRRGTRPRAAGEARALAGARRPRRFAGRVDDDELADLYARCLAVFYAPVDEDYGFVPYEAFLSEKPVVTTCDAGGPLEVVVGPGDRPRRASPTPAAVARGARVARRTTRTRRAARGRVGQGARRARHLGHDDRPAARRLKVAYFSPLPPERSGIADYSALLLPALRERMESASSSVAPGARRAARTSPSTTSATSPSAHGWIVDALRRRPGVVVLHDYVLHHLVAGNDARPRRPRRVPGRDGGARRARSAACSRTASSTASCRRSGRSAPHEFPLSGGGASRCSTASSSTPATSRSGARRRLRRTGLAGAASPAWQPPPRGRRTAAAREPGRR